MKWWAAWRLLRRELWRGEPRIMVLALVLAVAAVSAVGFFNDRISNAIRLQAASLIGADLVVSAGRALPDSLIANATEVGLESAKLVSFPTVVFTDDDDSALIALKAVSDGYPLRGFLKTGDTPEAAIKVTQGPRPGEAWIDPRLLETLEVSVGDEIALGDITLNISQVLQFEPDRSGSIWMLSPRVMMHYSDLEAANLLAPGSRARYRVLLAGAGVGDFESSIADTAEEQDWRLESASDANPRLSTALERLGRFLGLASLVTVLVSGAALLMSSHGFVRRQADAMALFRCFGVSGEVLRGIVWRWIVMLWLIASVPGVVLGYAVQYAGADIVANAVGLTLAAPSMQPVWVGLVVGAVTVCGFVLPTLFRLQNIPVMRVLRRDTQAGIAGWPAALAAVIAMAMLVSWQASSWRMASVVLAAMVIAPVLLWTLGYGLLRFARRLPRPLRPGIPLGITGFARRGAVSLVQMTALGSGILALALLGFVTRDLLDAWEQEIPADAPNYFFLNVQPHQVESFQAKLDEIVVADVDAQLFPMVRGRFVGVNDTDLRVEDFEDQPDRQSSLRRELNLTFADQPRDDYETIEGQWWTPEQGQREALVSVEEGFAQDFSLQLGDTVRFRIAGEARAATVAHIRRIEWESMRVNFFFVASPATLQDGPATWITATRVREDIAVGKMLRAFPGISALSVEEILNRIRGTLDQAQFAVRIVFGFSLLAGVVVLLAALRATREARRKEVALLRALGLAQRQLQKSVITEYALIGFCAAFVGAGVAAIAGWLVAWWVFEVTPVLRPSWWLGLSVVSAVLTAIAGTIAARGLINTPPQRVLQSE